MYLPLKTERHAGKQAIYQRSFLPHYRVNAYIAVKATHTFPCFGIWVLYFSPRETLTWKPRGILLWGGERSLPSTTLITTMHMFTSLSTASRTHWLMFVCLVVVLKSLWSFLYFPTRLSRHFYASHFRNIHFNIIVALDICTLQWVTPQHHHLTLSLV